MDLGSGLGAEMEREGSDSTISIKDSNSSSSGHMRSVEQVMVLSQIVYH